VQDSAVYADASATDDDILAARMRGLFDAGANAADFDTVTPNGLMPNWVLRPESKRDYPDSFLVP
jgi:hypothetical protein